jgi:hypothetical protein
MVIKLVGSVLDVFKAQGHEQTLVNNFEENEGVEKNRTLVGVDVPRTALVDFTGTGFSEFAEQCYAESTYKESYAQGNLDGGAAVDVYNIYPGKKANALHAKASKINVELQERVKVAATLYANAAELEIDSIRCVLIKAANALYAEASQLKREAEALEVNASDIMEEYYRCRKFLRFAYRDDAGVLSSFGLAFNENRPNVWVLQITRNTLAPQKDRTATLFSQGELVTSDVSTEVALDNLPEQIKLALNSDKMAQLFSGLIDSNGVVSIEKYEELNCRAHANKNIDNRDTKRQQLDELFQSAAGLLPDEYVAEIRQRIEEDINFFKAGNFEKITSAIYKKIKNEIYSQIQDKEAARSCISKSELTFYAIRFELLAMLLTEESEAKEQEAKLGVAKILRAAQNNPHPQTIEEIIRNGRMSALPERTNKPKELDQSFFKTNFGAFTFGVGGLFAAGVLLIMAGLFTPLGMAYAGLVTVLAVAGAVVAGAVGIAGIIKMLINERKFDKEKNQYNKDMDSYNKNFPASQKACEEDIQVDIQVLEAIKQAVALEVGDDEEALEEKKISDNDPVLERRNSEPDLSVLVPIDRQHLSRSKTLTELGQDSVEKGLSIHPPHLSLQALQVGKETPLVNVDPREASIEEVNGSSPVNFNSH